MTTKSVLKWWKRMNLYLALLSVFCLGRLGFSLVMQVLSFSNGSEGMITLIACFIISTITLLFSLIFFVQARNYRNEVVRFRRQRFLWHKRKKAILQVLPNDQALFAMALKENWLAVINVRDASIRKTIYITVGMEYLRRMAREKLISRDQEIDGGMDYWEKPKCFSFIEKFIYWSNRRKYSSAC